MNILAWNDIPSLTELTRTYHNYPKPLYWAVCLPTHGFPEFQPSANADPIEKELAHNITSKLGCLQFNSVNALQNVLPDVHLWLFPAGCTTALHAYFPQPIQWQTEPIAQQTLSFKPWVEPPQTHSKPEHVIVIGAGIAGAATAYELAKHGIKVTVLEAKTVAHGGSGNRQGLLYAKISPHPTEQTELLLAGYGYTRRLLTDLLDQSEHWGGSGVLHLNFNPAERKRNQALAEHIHHTHLYRSVSQKEAARLAGIEVFSDGLYWPQGVWLNPPALIHALLSHPFIQTIEHAPLLSTEFDGKSWTAYTPQGQHHGTHLIYATGAQSLNAPERNIAALPLRQIRGQTGVAQASTLSEKLRCAISAESYISPSYRGSHCYGASFVINCHDDQWRPEEEIHNRHALQKLNPILADSLFSDGLNPLAEAQGHAALRCDSHDHLPMVGPVGDIVLMQQAYAKLALDKNYRLNTSCPYLPNVWLNTAHGTRGLTTAPICAASLAAQILGMPNPLSPTIRASLHPNRAVIRAIIRRQNLL